MSRWFVVVLVGCGSSSVTPDAAPDAFVLTTHATGTVREWMSPTASGPALADAKVCVFDTDHCVQSDAAGNFTLDRVPATGDTGLAFSKPGYLRTVILMKAHVEDISLQVGVITDAVEQQKLADAGGTYPLAGTGIVEVGAYVMNGSSYAWAQGATSTLAGHTAVYLGLDGYPDQALTSSSAEGGVMFVNVAPADVEVSMMISGKSCVNASDGWHGSTAGTLRIPAQADTLTFTSVLCL